MTDRIRVLIAEDEPVVREALADLLNGEDGLSVVAVAADAEEAVALAREHRPDVALLDVRMPKGGGPHATRGIRLKAPQTRIVALSAYGDSGTVSEMLRAGAVGFLVKGIPGHELVTAIRRTVRGEITLSHDVATGVLRDLTDELARQDADAAAEQRLRSQIRDVIASPALTAVGQPIVRLDDFAVVGVEALARFHVEPPRSPDIWFANADRVGLRIELELAALRRAIALLPLIPAECYLGVNLSPSTLLTADLGAVIREAGPRVVVELTEHAPVHDYQRLNVALEALREAGCRIAIDDAGAGFASLRHILQVAPDIIKLDLSLTRDIHLHRNRRALATALTTFATEIGAQIVAEGIETREELATLTSLGINHGQGFYLARPAPLTADLPRHVTVPGAG